MLSVLDTSILIAEAPARVAGEIAISIVSVAELQFGVLVARDDQGRARRLARLSAILRRFEPLPVDASVAASCMASLPRRRTGPGARRLHGAWTS
jgi:predicted nucleic acid-binding protein